MLTDEKKDCIHSVIEGDPSHWLTAISAIQSSEELRYFLTCYNWDDGYIVPKAIAENMNCDLGIAVELFWLAAADCWYLGEIERTDCNQEWFSFCQFITNRILAGEYAIGKTTFRLGVSVAKIYQWRKKGLPEVFLKDVVGAT